MPPSLLAGRVIPPQYAGMMPIPTELDDGELSADVETPGRIVEPGADELGVPKRTEEAREWRR